ncbi:serine hydrolase [Capnocytophaga sp.]|uniref:serine hydrolase n=1 Tax=Capnocytophaga sp. TaxID=44737 RepID=UPI0026DD55FE|nr:serine hydrolase [Capnocytophaga sp.]MDO5106627.1 serine hydrolase [Capnocytophaga sp.]
MRKIALLFVALQCSSFVFAQSKAERLDSLFTSLHSKEAFHGNVLIAENGKTIFEKSYGLENIEKNTNLTPKSVFNLASVSKQFTASAILLLEKSKKLRLSDDITKYIPELSFYKGITIEHLVHHTSGLPDYMALFREKDQTIGTITNNDVIELFAKEQPELLFEPNQEFKYSNTGYLFLATIIERVSKTSYANYLKKHIFKPLKMNNTAVLFLYKDKLTMPNLAVGYTQDENGNLQRDVQYAQYFDGVYGQGRVYSTAEDLLKWAKALQNNTLFTKQQSDILFADYTLNNNQNTEYGFGLFLEESEKYGKIINHSGSWGGYITYLEQQLTHDKTIVLLQNQALITTKIPVKAIRSILYNEPLKSEKPIALQSEDLDKYLGTYSNNEIGLDIVITKKGNVLYSQATEQPEIPLEAYENHTFKFEPANIKLIFNPDENVFELRQGSMGFIFKKVEK